MARLAADGVLNSVPALNVHSGKINGSDLELPDLPFLGHDVKDEAEITARVTSPVAAE